MDARQQIDTYAHMNRALSLYEGEVLHGGHSVIVQDAELFATRMKIDRESWMNLADHS